jgi:hypothetical protein
VGLSTEVRYYTSDNDPYSVADTIAYGYTYTYSGTKSYTNEDIGCNTHTYTHRNSESYPDAYTNAS